MIRSACLLALIIASLSSAVGCGSSATLHSGTHGPEGAAALARDDARWCSPEEVELRMLEKPSNNASVAGAQVKAVTSYRPNKNDRPTKGAVHAATY